MKQFCDARPDFLLRTQLRRAAGACDARGARRGLADHGRRDRAWGDRPARVLGSVWLCAPLPALPLLKLGGRLANPPPCPGPQSVRNPERFNRYRAVELKHGRIAMAATTGAPPPVESPPPAA